MRLLGVFSGCEQPDLPQDGHAWRCGYSHAEKSSVELHPLSLWDTVSLTSLEITLMSSKFSTPPNFFLSVHLCSYDDYDYGSVNVLLERSLKVFVKTMACHPEQTTARIYHTFWRHFRHSEKVWVQTPPDPASSTTVNESFGILSCHLSLAPSGKRMNSLTFQGVVLFEKYLLEKAALQTGLTSVWPERNDLFCCLFF